MNRILLALASTAALSAGAHAATVGVTMDKFDDKFLTGVRNAIAAEGRAKGATVKVVDAQDDTGRQIGQIQSFIAQKVDAIVINAVDTSATPRMTQLAVAAKIPLIYVNRKPEDKVLPANVTYVGSDEAVAGRLEGEGLVTCLGGKGNIVIVEGHLSNNASLDRTAEIEKLVVANPGLKIVHKQAANWDRNQAQDLMSSWLAAGDRIDGVAANNDEMAIGTILAFKQAGKDPTKVCIGGIDATADGLAEIETGNLHVTVFQDARAQGKGALDIALKMIGHETVPSYVDVPFEKVTKDNVGAFVSR